MPKKLEPKEFELKDFVFGESPNAKLKKFKTKIPNLFKDEKSYKHEMHRRLQTLETEQEKLYASAAYSILIVFQGMDTSGKDGAIKHVMTGINPQGCDVTSFKKPSESDLKHDFLWRCYKNLPEKGKIGIFNRSYYEDVVAVRIHHDYLLSEKIPGQFTKKKKKFWNSRFEAINSFEEHLRQSGTEVIKIFLHLSKTEQKNRLLARIENESKNWKFSESDFTERQFWPEYLNAYTDCLKATSTVEIPWYVVPADEKKNCHYIVSEIIAMRLKKLHLKWPIVGKKQKSRLKELKKLIQKAD